MLAETHGYQLEELARKQLELVECWDSTISSGAVALTSFECNLRLLVQQPSDREKPGDQDVRTALLAAAPSAALQRYFEKGFKKGDWGSADVEDLSLAYSALRSCKEDAQKCAQAQKRLAAELVETLETYSGCELAVDDGEVYCKSSAHPYCASRAESATVLAPDTVSFTPGRSDARDSLVMGGCDGRDSTLSDLRHSPVSVSDTGEWRARESKQPVWLERVAVCTSLLADAWDRQSQLMAAIVDRVNYETPIEHLALWKELWNLQPYVGGDLSAVMASVRAGDWLNRDEKDA